MEGAPLILSRGSEFDNRSGCRVVFLDGPTRRMGVLFETAILFLAVLEPIGPELEVGLGVITSWGVLTWEAGLTEMAFEPCTIGFGPPLYKGTLDCL